MIQVFMKLYLNICKIRYLQNIKLLVRRDNIFLPTNHVLYYYKVYCLI